MKSPAAPPLIGLTGGGGPGASTATNDSIAFNFEDGGGVGGGSLAEDPRRHITPSRLVVRAPSPANANLTNDSIAFNFEDELSHVSAQKDPMAVRRATYNPSVNSDAHPESIAFNMEDDSDDLAPPVPAPAELMRSPPPPASIAAKGIPPSRVSRQPSLGSLQIEFENDGTGSAVGGLSMSGLGPAAASNVTVTPHADPSASLSSKSPATTPTADGEKERQKKTVVGNRLKALSNRTSPARMSPNYREAAAAGELPPTPKARHGGAAGGQQHPSQLQVSPPSAPLPVEQPPDQGEVEKKRKSVAEKEGKERHRRRRTSASSSPGVRSPALSTASPSFAGADGEKSGKTSPKPPEREKERDDESEDIPAAAQTQVPRGLQGGAAPPSPHHHHLHGPRRSTSTDHTRPPESEHQPTRDDHEDERIRAWYRQTVLSAGQASLPPGAWPPTLSVPPPMSAASAGDSQQRVSSPPPTQQPYASPQSDPRAAGNYTGTLATVPPAAVDPRVVLAAENQTDHWRAFNEAQRMELEKLKLRIAAARRQDRTVLEASTQKSSGPGPRKTVTITAQAGATPKAAPTGAGYASLSPSSYPKRRGSLGMAGTAATTTSAAPAAGAMAAAEGPFSRKPSSTAPRKPSAPTARPSMVSFMNRPSFDTPQHASTARDTRPSYAALDGCGARSPRAALEGPERCPRGPQPRHGVPRPYRSTSRIAVAEEETGRRRSSNGVRPSRDGVTGSASAAAETVANLLGVLWPPSHPEELFFVSGSRLTPQQVSAFYETVQVQEAAQVEQRREVSEAFHVGPNVSSSSPYAALDTMSPSKLRQRSRSPAATTAASHVDVDHDLALSTSLHPARAAVGSLAYERAAAAQGNGAQQRKQSKKKKHIVGRSQVVRDVFDLLDLRHCGFLYAGELSALKVLLEEELAMLDDELYGGTASMKGPRALSPPLHHQSRALLSSAVEGREVYRTAMEGLSRGLKHVDDAVPTPLTTRQAEATARRSRHALLCSFAVNVVLPLAAASRISALDFPTVSLLVFEAVDRNDVTRRTPEGAAWREVVGQYFEALSA